MLSKCINRNNAVDGLIDQRSLRINNLKFLSGNSFTKMNTILTHL